MSNNNCSLVVINIMKSSKLSSLSYGKTFVYKREIGSAAKKCIYFINTYIKIKVHYSTGNIKLSRNTKVRHNCSCQTKRVRYLQHLLLLWLKLHGGETIIT